jgi:hypothetical protein
MGRNRNMRDFSEADKKEKQARIQIKENPAGLAPEVLAQLGEKVKASLRKGYLPCGAAFKIARDAGVPKIAVGEVADRLGIRVSNCQIGFFKVDKTLHDNLDNSKIDDAIVARLEALRDKNELNCAGVFGLAREMKLTPMAIADVANVRKLKIHRCQLGCF